MNAFFLLLLLPAIPAIGWAINVKLKEQKYFDAIVIGIPALSVLVSAYLVYVMISGSMSPVVHWFQMFFSATIVPFSYLYFSRQIGRQFNNGTNIVLWLLVLFLLIPMGVIFLSEDQSIFDISQLSLFVIQFVRNDQIMFSIFTGDFVVLAQALITMLRMFPMFRKLRTYGLRLDKKMYAFGVWWAMAILFIITVSLNDIEILLSAIGSIYFFGGLSLLIIAIYILIALHFDLQPVQTKEGEVVHNVDTYIVELQSALIDQVRHLVEHDQVYLQPGYRTEDVLKALATNRTYFTRMMHEQFGKTFSQYLNEHRLAYAQQLLLTTELTQNEIAMQSGFNDATYMSRMFKAAYNLTPKQWQAENKAMKL